MAEKYVLTDHVRERYIQRKDPHYSHLQHCRATDCPTCAALHEEAKAELARNEHEINMEVLDHVRQGTECRSYLNNTNFMQWYYDKYGYNRRFQFLVHDKFLFVVILENGRKTIVTCMNAKTHFAARSAMRPKYKKVKA